MQTVGRAAATVGVLGGGAMAELLGVHAVMWAAVVVALASAPIAALSELRSVSLVPSPTTHAAQGVDRGAAASADARPSNIIAVGTKDGLT
jgi:hypothetical protein